MNVFFHKKGGKLISTASFVHNFRSAPTVERKFNAILMNNFKCKFVIEV